MRTFGTEADNLIDVELAYGTNNYQLTWFQNGLQRDIEVTKATIHFVGAKLPLGNVTIDYMELDTSYLNFLEEDAIRIDITEDDSTLTVGTFYVAPGFTKTKYDASYTAYSSLVDLGLKLDAWDGAPESATIKDIVHHFTEPLNLVFDVEPSSTVTFNASVADFSSITLGELIGYCACIEQCNYVLRGNVLHKIVPTTAVTKEYNIDDVVYSENLSKTTSDATLDYIKVNYKTVSRTTDDDGQVSYDFNDASYICKDGTESCGFELNIGLVPTSESALQVRFSTYFSSIKGMDCNGYNISFLGDARVEIGDKLKFSNSDTSAVLNVSELIWEWDGGLKCTISSGTESSSSSGSGFSIQQVVSQIQAMTNAVKNVQYNAVYANELYAKTAELGFASINELTTEVAKMGLLTAEEADIRYATVQNLDILQGKFDDLAGRTLTVDTMNARLAELDYLTAADAELAFLSAADAALKYANIDFSNVTVQAVEKLFVNVGILENATITEGKITGTLSGVRIVADVIEANTIVAGDMVVQADGSDLFYKINVEESGASIESIKVCEYEKYISGQDIVSKSITAEQIATQSLTANEIDVKDIFAQDITATGTITGASLYGAYLETVGGRIGCLDMDENAIGIGYDKSRKVISKELFYIDKYLFKVGNSLNYDLVNDTFSIGDAALKGRLYVTDKIVVENDSGILTLSPDASSEGAMLSIEGGMHKAEIYPLKFYLEFDMGIDDADNTHYKYHADYGCNCLSILKNDLISGEQSHILTANEGGVRSEDFITNSGISLNELSRKLFLLAHPIGTIYITAYRGNPGTTYGGTWIAWGTGRVPVGVDTSDTNFNAPEKTGGVSTVTLTTAQMPAHVHGLNGHSHGAGTLSASAAGAHTHKSKITNKKLASGTNFARIDSTSGTLTTGEATNSSGAHTHTVVGNTAGASGNTTGVGGGSPHSNLQPYITCYMWKRTA